MEGVVEGGVGVYPAPAQHRRVAIGEELRDLLGGKGWEGLRKLMMVGE